MSDEQTLELARAAGLNPHWTDYRGRSHAVPLDTLRALLANLDLPAGDETQARDSLRRLHAERAARMPARLVGRVGAPLTLPPSLRYLAGSDPLVEYADGDTTHVHCEHDGSGCARLSGLYRPGEHVLRLGDRRIPLAVAPAYRVAELTLRPRRWGVAVQLYGLRHGRDREFGDLGIGDFTTLAELASRLGGLGAEALATSPVHALFSADVHHFSPYAPSSRLFLNVLHVDPGELAGNDWVRERIDALGLGAPIEALQRAELIDWPAAAQIKLQLLRELWREFRRLDADGRMAGEFASFRADAGTALEDHARFEAIHAVQFGAQPDRWHWRSWPAGLRDPRSREVAEFAAANADEVAFHAFLQWLADRGLGAAQRQARDGGMQIGLIGDLAVGTDRGGSHAWSRQDDMLHGMSIGAPPDELNRRGQDWGLTTFSPRALRQHGYAPFSEMLRAALRHAGGVRIDHILGIHRLWLVPDGAGPRDGAYVDYPRQDLINLIALEAWRRQATVVGEDLGTVPEGFRDDLATHGLLGMRVLHFERDHGCFVDPARWDATAVALTTTHDLPTVAGWWRGRDLDWQQRLDLLPSGHTPAQEQQHRARDREALWNAFVHAGIADGPAPARDDAQVVVDRALTFVARTPGPLALIPLEDLLGLDEQPNLPGTTDQHPNWRRRCAAPVDALLSTPAVTARIARLQAERGGP